MCSCKQRFVASSCTFSYMCLILFALVNNLGSYFDLLVYLNKCITCNNTIIFFYSLDGLKFSGAGFRSKTSIL